MSSTQKRFFCLIITSLLIICLTSSNRCLNTNKAQLLTTAYAAEHPIPFQGETNEQLRALLQERYEVLRAVAGLLNQQYSAGRIGILEIRDAIIEMFNAEAELRPTNSEKIKVYEKLVKILQEQDMSLAKEVNTGKVNQMDFLKSRLATLEVQIQLEKLRPSQGTPQ